MDRSIDQGPGSCGNTEGLDPSLVAAAQIFLELQMSSARVRDFSYRVDEERRVNIVTCSGQGGFTEIEYKYNPAAPKKDRYPVQQLSVRLPDGNSLILDAAADPAVGETLNALGAPVAWRFTERVWESAHIALSALREPLEIVLKNKPNSEICFRSHVTDVVLGKTDEGLRTAEFYLHVEDFPAYPAKFLSSASGDGSVPVSHPSYRMGETVPFRMCLTEVKPKEQDGALNALTNVAAHPVAVPNATYQSKFSRAHALLLAMHRSPALFDRRNFAMPLLELVATVFAGIPRSERVDELLESRQQLQRALFFALTETEPCDRADFKEGDFICHISPSVIPGIKAEFFKVEALGTEFSTEDETSTLKMNEIAEDGSKTALNIHRIVREKFSRTVAESSIPHLPGVSLIVQFDHDLIPQRVCNTHFQDWLGANSPSYGNYISLTVGEGLFEYCVAASDPLSMTLARSLEKAGVEVVIPVEYRDERTVSAIFRHDQIALTRRLERLSDVRFKGPAYWKVPDYVQNAVAQLARCMSECTEADFLSLAADGWF